MMSALFTSEERTIPISVKLHDLVGAWSSDELGPITGEVAYDALAEAAADHMTVRAVSLYVIDPGHGTYRRLGVYGRSATPTHVPALPRLCEPDTDAQYMQEVIRRALQQSASEDGDDISVFHRSEGNSHVIGLRYVETVYTFLWVSSDVPPTPESMPELEFLAHLSFLTSQHIAARSALRANQRPIDITADADEFYGALASFLVESTGMELIALRQRGAAGTPEEKNLTCTAIIGWPLPKSQFNMEGYSRFRTFDRAIANRESLFSPDPGSKELQEFWLEYPHLEIVESFAVFPVEDDERVIGVLSVAARCRLDFTPTLKSIIAGIARFVGFALKNRELHFSRAELQVSAIETGAALDAIEVYSDFTHQMGNELATVPEVVETVSSAVKKGKELEPRDLLGDAYLGGIVKAHDRISELIQQVEGVTASQGEIEMASIAELWRDAASIVEFRAHKYDVEIKKPKDFRIEIYPLQIRQVFFHLMLNSISAFSGRGSKRKPRTIELITHAPKPPSKTLTLVYVDTAGGINPAALRKRGKHASAVALPSPEIAIFMRGVTSKSSGTGNGLWIVRQILQRHFGSIQLLEHREGAVFEIRLPTDFRALVSRGKVM